MNKTIKSALLFIFVISIITLLYSGFKGFGCAWGGDYVSCGVARNVTIPLVIFTFIYVLFVNFISNKFVKLIRLPFYLSAIYFLLILFFVITPIAYEGGLLADLIKGTSIECKINAGRFSGDECYKNLAIKNNDVKICEKIVKEYVLKNECLSYFLK